MRKMPSYNTNMYAWQQNDQGLSRHFHLVYPSLQNLGDRHYARCSAIPMKVPLVTHPFDPSSIGPSVEGVVEHRQKSKISQD